MTQSRAIALAALALLTSAATAHAECAWVLWQQDITIHGGDPPGKLNQGFLIVRAFKSKADCENESKVELVESSKIPVDPPNAREN